MRNRLQSHTGATQLASLAVIGIGIGLIAGFMFVSVVEMVSPAPFW